MKFTIGRYDEETRSVAVTFVQGAIRHSRAVNAVLQEDGSYDRLATKARVEDVARGVAAKITAGIISA